MEDIEKELAAIGAQYESNGNWISANIPKIGLVGFRKDYSGVEGKFQNDNWITFSGPTVLGVLKSYIDFQIKNHQKLIFRYEGLLDELGISNEQ